MMLSIVCVIFVLQSIQYSNLFSVEPICDVRYNIRLNCPIIKVKCTLELYVFDILIFKL